MKRLIRILILILFLPFFFGAQEAPSPEDPSLLVHNTTNVAVGIYAYNGDKLYGPAIVRAGEKRCLVMDMPTESKIQFGIAHDGIPRWFKAVFSPYPFMMEDGTGWSLIVREHGFEIYDLMNIKQITQCHTEQVPA